MSCRSPVGAVAIPGNRRRGAHSHNDHPDLRAPARRARGRRSRRCVSGSDRVLACAMRMLHLPEEPLSM